MSDQPQAGDGSDRPPAGGPDLSKDPWAVPEPGAPTFPPPPAASTPPAWGGPPAWAGQPPTWGGPPSAWGGQPPAWGASTSALLDPNDPYRFGPPGGSTPQPYGQPGYAPPPGYGPPPGYPPYYGYGSYPVTPTENGKALAGMIIGIVAFVLCWIPFIGFFPPVLGIIFSSLGLGAARRGLGRRGMAVAGLGLSVLAILANVIISVVIVVGTTRSCDSADTSQVGTLYIQCS